MKSFKKSWVPAALPTSGSSRIGPSPTPRTSNRLGTIRVLLLTLSIWWNRNSKKKLGQLTERLTKIIQDQGGLWVKLAQILSSRTDLLPRELCHRLSGLTDRSQPFEFGSVEQVVQSELGNPIESFFDYFDPVPVAAASIGQVHRARLIGTDNWVAVKVQRPEIETTFRSQLRSIKTLFWALSRFRRLAIFRWADLLAELEQVLLEESDYRIEAVNARRMRKSLRQHGIYVPKVLEEVSSQRVLVMEFIDGVSVADYIAAQREEPTRAHAWAVDNEIDPSRVARSLFLSFRRQLFEDNLFHGDLHPGNILLLRGGKVCLIDFGATGTLDPEFLAKYAAFGRSWANCEFDKAVDLMLMLYSSVPDLDLSVAKSRLSRCMQAWDQRARVKSLPYTEKSLTTCMAQLMKILVRHRCPVEWSFLRIIRAQGTLESVLGGLHPSIDESKLLRVHFRKSDKRIRKAALSASSIRTSALAIQALRELPLLMHERLLYHGPKAREEARRLKSQAPASHRLSLVTLQLLTLAWGALGGLVALGLVHRTQPSWTLTQGKWLSTLASQLPDVHLGLWLVAAIAWISVLRSMRRQSRSSAID